MTQRSKKICLMYTGGTIGMIEDDEGVKRPPRNPLDFLRVAPELDPNDFEFEPLLNKDSTNMVPSDWTTMAKAIYDRRNVGYEGFVIAHGTDTMHFSASALAFALGPTLNFPVVFTGAQTIPKVQHGDARINLLRAMRVAKEPLAEVVISFGDYVFRGCRTQKKDEKRFDAFESPAFYPIADITERIIFHPTAKLKGHANAGEIQLRAEFADGILQVGLIPGLKPALLDPILEAGNCSGIVLQSFGAGNVPNLNEFGFGDFIGKAVGKAIPVVITSQFPANSTLETRYEPGVAAVDAGAIPTGNMTSAAATVKFRWVLARVDKEMPTVRSNDALPEQVRKQYLERVRVLMNTTYVGEMGAE